MDYVLNGEKYILNLIDTPGHVDFSYEVSRSIAACEGALLVVDAAQSIQAQTISNLYLALENGLTIIPVLNKIDLPSAKPEEVADDIVALIDCRPEDIIHASGKTGQGVEDILRAIVERIPAPVGDPDAPLEALVFDSVFNSFRGVEAYYKVVNGTIHQGEKVKFMATGKSYLADEVGTLKLKKQAKKQISAATWATSSRASRKPSKSKGATPSPRSNARPPNPSRASRKSSPWSLPASTRWTPKTTKSCARRWKNST